MSDDALLRLIAARCPELDPDDLDRLARALALDDASQEIFALVADALDALDDKLASLGDRLGDRLGEAA